MNAIVVGAGKLGYRLAESLSNEGIDVTVLEKNPAVAMRADSSLDALAITANGLDIEALKEAGIDKCDFFVAVTGNDETNMVLCSLAKKMGKAKTIARIRGPEYGRQKENMDQGLGMIEAMGIDKVINPDFAAANEIMKYLLKKFQFYTDAFALGKVTMMEIRGEQIPSILNKTLLEITELQGLIVAAIRRDGEVIVPDGSTKIQPKDLLYIIGKTETVNQINGTYSLSVMRKNLKKAMILGGGNIAYYLARRMIDAGMSVVVVEQDMDRIQYLSNHIGDAIIIHGDGTDVKLLEEENLSQTDMFISVTGFDEQNLLMALLAKSYGVCKVVSKISRDNYITLVDNLDIDFAINPVDIFCSSVHKYIHGGELAAVSMLLERKARVIEVIARKGAKVMGTPLKELNLPRGIIIGSLLRKGEVVIPDGNTVIEAGDRLVVFCLDMYMKQVDKLFRGRLSWGREVLHEL